MGCDLTPCDFFLWCWLKEQVYSTKPTTSEELEGQICEVMSSMPQELFMKSVDAASDCGRHGSDTHTTCPTNISSPWQTQICYSHNMPHQPQLTVAEKDMTLIQHAPPTTADCGRQGYDTHTTCPTHHS